MSGSVSGKGANQANVYGMNMNVIGPVAEHTEFSNSPRMNKIFYQSLLYLIEGQGPWSRAQQWTPSVGQKWKVTNDRVNEYFLK